MAFSINGAGLIVYSYGKKVGVDPYLTPYTKIILWWVKNFNVIAKTITLLGENIGSWDMNYKSIIKTENHQKKRLVR